MTSAGVCAEAVRPTRALALTPSASRDKVRSMVCLPYVRIMPLMLPGCRTPVNSTLRHPRIDRTDTGAADVAGIAGDECHSAHEGGSGKEPVDDRERALCCKSPPGFRNFGIDR